MGNTGEAPKLNVFGAEAEKRPCVFCEIVTGNEPSSKIAEFGNAVAISDLQMHPLVLPKKHLETIDEDNEGMMTDVYMLAERLAEVIRESSPESGVVILSNRGKAVGQEISHLHVHLIQQLPGERRFSLRFPGVKDRQQLDQYAEMVGSLYNTRYATPVKS